MITKSKLFNLCQYIYIYQRQTYSEGRLFTNKNKQSLFNYERRLLTNNSLQLQLGGAL